MQAYAVGAWQAAVPMQGPHGPITISYNKVSWVPRMHTLWEPGRQWRQPFWMVAS